MRVVWVRNQLSINMPVDDAKVLLTWLQTAATTPGSVEERLKMRLQDSYRDWSRFVTKP